MIVPWFSFCTYVSYKNKEIVDYTIVIKSNNIHLTLALPCLSRHNLII